MADWREKKADRFGSAGAPSYAAGFSTETAGAMSGVLDSLSDCQREILDRFNAARNSGLHVTSHDFIRWAHSYRKTHPSLVRKLANSFTGFFEVFGALFDSGEASGDSRESPRGGDRSTQNDGGCIYTYLPELNQTVRGCPVN